MFLLIDEREALVVLFNDIDRALEYINSLELEVDTTMSRSRELTGYTYNCYKDDNWKESIKNLFGIRVEKVVLGEEVYL